MERLTIQEQDVMLAIWRVGEGNIKAFMQEMDMPPPYTTIASTVKNLERKGFVKYRTFGNVNVYTPAISEEEYKKKFMGSFIKEHFDNSYKELVSFFVNHKKLSAKELKEVLKMIETGKTK